MAELSVVEQSMEVGFDEEAVDWGGDKEDEVPEFEVDSHAQGIAADVVKEVAAEVVVSQSAEDEWEWVEVEEDDENAGLPYSWERAPGQTCVTRTQKRKQQRKRSHVARGECKRRRRW